MRPIKVGCLPRQLITRKIAHDRPDLRRHRRWLRNQRRLGREGADREGPQGAHARAGREHRAHHRLRERPQGAVGAPPPRPDHEPDPGGAHATITRGTASCTRPTPTTGRRTQESPYVEKRPFNWFRGYHVGGRSLMWGRQSYRWNRFDYEANLKEGVGVDWPIRYEDMAPWYDHAESWAGISGSLEGLEQLPDGKFLPPMELNVVEKDVAARIKAHYADARRMIIGRVANLTGAAQRPQQLPVPQQVRPRLPVRRLFQHPVLHPAGRGEDGKPDPAALLDRDPGDSTTRTRRRPPASRCSTPRPARPPSTRRRSSSSAPRPSTRPGS